MTTDEIHNIIWHTHVYDSVFHEILAIDLKKQIFELVTNSAVSSAFLPIKHKKSMLDYEMIETAIQLYEDNEKDK